MMRKDRMRQISHLSIHKMEAQVLEMMRGSVAQVLDEKRGR